MVLPEQVFEFSSLPTRHLPSIHTLRYSFTEQALPERLLGPWTVRQLCIGKGAYVINNYTLQGCLILRHLFRFLLLVSLNLTTTSYGTGRTGMNNVGCQRVLTVNLTPPRTVCEDSFNKESSRSVRSWGVSGGRCFVVNLCVEAQRLVGSPIT